jgi:hypothetical protein
MDKPRVAKATSPELGTLVKFSPFSVPIGTITVITAKTISQIKSPVVFSLVFIIL